MWHAGTPTWVPGELDPDDSWGNWLLRTCFYDGSGVYISQQTVASGGAGSLNTSWQFVGGQVTTPAGTATMQVWLYNYMNTGWVAFDDLSLVKQGTSTNLLTNPGFETGSSGWTEFADPRLTSALLDRLTHRCHILEFSGESYRFRQSLQRQAFQAKVGEPLTSRVPDPPEPTVG